MSPSIRRVWTMIEKDGRIHGRDFLAAHGAVLGIATMAAVMKPSEGALNAGLVFNLNVLFAGLWSEWLISREKTKGTFAWLRACAVSDSELVLAKFLAVGLCTTTLWAASVYFVRPTMSEWIALWFALLAFSGVAVLSRWRFGAKLGQALPYAVLLVPLLIVILLERTLGVRADLPDLLGDPAGQYAAAVLLLAVWIGLFAGVRSWVRGADTYRLLE